MGIITGVIRVNLPIQISIMVALKIDSWTLDPDGGRAVVRERRPALPVARDQ
ncbi:MAG: hypothetical protein LBS60_09385 [Deltaproteobacteria bacterium]|nr:hypothetical protein [Deltaproteobacteria bacterium]